MLLSAAANPPDFCCWSTFLVSLSILHIPEVVHTLTTEQPFQEPATAHHSPTVTLLLQLDCKLLPTKLQSTAGKAGSAHYYLISTFGIRQGYLPGPHGCTVVGRKYLQELCIHQKHKENELKQ